MPPKLAKQVENIMAGYVGGECVFVPSGRMALYLALKVWLPAGAKVLMSPIDDDVIFFTVIAAGMRPVMAPISDKTGNMDIDAILEETWQMLDAVMTMNHHGAPDEMELLLEKCREHDLFLLEDAAHALGIFHDGKPLGSFGDAAGFSFSKHLGIHGGALCFKDASKMDAIRKAYREAIQVRPLKKKIEDVVRPLLWSIMDFLHIRKLVWKIKSGLGLTKRKARQGKSRMPLRAEQLRSAQASRDIGAFDPWVLVDGPMSRTETKNKEIAALISKLQPYLDDNSDWLKGVEKLTKLDAAIPITRELTDQPLMRVPLLVESRESIRGKLRESSMSVPYVYFPPLDEYAGTEFCDPSTAPENAQWWGEHVLPIPPLFADKFIGLVDTLGLDIRLARRDKSL